MIANENFGKDGGFDFYKTAVYMFQFVWSGFKESFK